MERLVLFIEGLVVLGLIVFEIFMGDFIPLFAAVMVLACFIYYVRKKQRAFQQKLEEQKRNKELK